MSGPGREREGKVKESSLTLPAPLEFVLMLYWPIHPPVPTRPKQIGERIQKNGYSSHQKSDVACCDVKNKTELTLNPGSGVA